MSWHGIPEYSLLSRWQFFFSNLVNSLFSSKTTLTHAIRGFPLCQQRGLLELGNKLHYFSAILRKRRSQSWGIFRMSNWKTAGAHHPKIKPLISDKHLIQASQYFLGLIEVFTSLLPTSWVNRKREPEVVLHSCLFKANIWDLKKKTWSGHLTDASLSEATAFLLSGILHLPWKCAAERCV